MRDNVKLFILICRNYLCYLNKGVKNKAQFSWEDLKNLHHQFYDGLSIYINLSVHVKYDY